MHEVSGVRTEGEWEWSENAFVANKQGGVDNVVLAMANYPTQIQTHVCPAKVGRHALQL